MIEKGHLRINTQKCKKPGHSVMVGDILTFVQADVVRVVRIDALAERRGSATIAQQLYTDLTPSAP
jgi:ribosome-associated heat shock protein Hsp15